MDVALTPTSSGETLADVVTYSNGAWGRWGYSPREVVHVWNGMPTVVPIQGAIVASVFLIIAFVKVFRGVRGTDAILWNTVGVVTLLYLFTSVAWIAFGGLTQ